MKHTFQSEITEKLYKNWENNYPFEKEMFQPGTYIKSITLGECEAAFEAGFIEGFKQRFLMEIPNTVTSLFDAFFAQCLSIWHLNKDFLSVNDIYKCYCAYIGNIGKPMEFSKFSEKIKMSLPSQFIQYRKDKEAIPEWGFTCFKFTDFGKLLFSKAIDKETTNK